ncbi:unnamed protein product [Fasciola hepatica]|uniref:Uncharacterized protein n=1 Tax=Fasciola hepatica TaxID=6192 RepID=A0ABC9HHA3_FASHE
MFLMHIILFLLCSSISDVDCQGNLSDSINTLNNEMRGWNGVLTNFGNQLVEIIQNMNEQPASANDRAFSNELKQDYAENLDLKKATVRSISLLRYSCNVFKSALENGKILVRKILNGLRSLDTLLELMSSHLDKVASKWFRKQWYHPANQNRNLYILVNGKVTPIKYSTEIQNTFFRSMNRAKRWTTVLQQKMNQLQSLILLSRDSNLHSAGH